MNKKEKSMRRNDNTLQLKVSEVSRMSKVSGQGRLACTTTQVAAKGGQVRSTTLETAKEVRSTIIHDKTRHETAKPASCKFLITQSLSHLITSQKAAFTLAEILITLAVIGIVAALTIPNLVMKYKEKVTVTKLRKAYSIINSAYQMALLENGDFDNWGFYKTGIVETDEDGNLHFNDTAIYDMSLLWEKIGKNLNITEKCMPEQNNCTRIKAYYNLNGEERRSDINNVPNITLNNGMVLIGGWVNSASCTNKNDICSDFAIDINGSKQPPNAFGQDIFYFYIHPNNIMPIGGKTEPSSSRTFENNCNRTSTSEDAGYGCTAWVIEKGNMDYLHCNDLSWTGKQKCD